MMKCHEIQVPSSPISSAEPMTSGQKTMQKGSPWAAQSMARPLTGTSKFQGKEELELSQFVDLGAEPSEPNQSGEVQNVPLPLFLQLRASHLRNQS